MQRGEIWFAATPGGDRPVRILTRDPVADRIGSVVVVALTQRGIVSELMLTPDADGVPTECVANFDNLHTYPGNRSAGGSLNWKPPGWRQPVRYYGTQPAAEHGDSHLEANEFSLDHVLRASVMGQDGEQIFAVERKMRVDPNPGHPPVPGVAKQLSP